MNEDGEEITVDVGEEEDDEELEDEENEDENEDEADGGETPADMSVSVQSHRHNSSNCSAHTLNCGKCWFLQEAVDWVDSADSARKRKMMMTTENMSRTEDHTGEPGGHTLATAILRFRLRRARNSWREAHSA
jgi:hypothetical protein